MRAVPRKPRARHKLACVQAIKQDDPPAATAVIHVTLSVSFFDPRLLAESRRVEERLVVE